MFWGKIHFIQDSCSKAYLHNKFLTDSFVTQATIIYNSLPCNIRLKTTSKASLKKQLKDYFWKVFLKDPKITDMKDDIESIRFQFSFFSSRF